MRLADTAVLISFSISRAFAEHSCYKRRPIHHNLLAEPSAQAVVIVDEDDLDPRPNAALPPPDGDSEGRLAVLKNSLKLTLGFLVVASVL